MASDQVLITAITGGLALCGTIYTGVMSYFMLKLKGTLDDVHTLTNSNMGTQLEMNVMLAKRLVATSKKKEDVEVLALAEQKLADHNAKQSLVDLDAK